MSAIRLDPAVGPRILEGPELDELKYSADFYDDLRDPAKYASAVVVSQGPFEGEDCYEVKLVRKSGFTYHEFFSVKTGLLTGVKMNVTSQMGTVPVTTVHSEYKTFGGVMTPTVTRQKMMGLESITTIDAMTFEPVDAKAFALPDSIAALAAQKKPLPTMTDNRLNADDALRQILGALMPPSHARRLGHAERIELDTERAFRARNKISYRLNHWPIWIWTFFIAPGPLTFDLFAHGFDWRMAAWLAVVLVATGVAGLFGKLPGVEPAPYIIRFTEDRPNPLYRRICYTFAWSAVVTFAVLNIAGLVMGGRDRRVAAPADLRRGVFPDRRQLLAAGRARSSAARQAIDEERRARAPLLLRFGVGRLCRAARAGDSVDQSCRGRARSTA